MDDTSTSASSSASESDAYNTESARLYFGPVKTPERKFVANSRRLLPLQLPHSIRRSPRLSSPRPQPQNVLSTLDQESAAQEARDVDLVAELVNEVEVGDDEQMSYPHLGTPPREEEFEPDEPLSALADKILHAVDNPSPPPSPATALKMFDPYHPANLTDSGEYESDLLFPHVTQRPTPADSYPLPGFSSGPTSETAMNQDLIVFDSPIQLPSLNHIEPVTIPQQPMSVDDLLAKSPDASLSYQPSQTQEPALLLDVPTSGGVGGDLMSVDSPNELPEVGHSAPDHSPDMQERQTQDEPHSSFPIQPALADDTIMTPLRRSTRPRKSVAPTPSPQPPVTIAPPSIARTSVKKKDSFRNLDEDITNNPKDGDDDRKSPSRALPSTPRSRHRSPSKEPFSFHREVGSLSPTSASVLSSLAFNSIDIHGQTIGSTSNRSRSMEPSTALSFSVFVPSGGTSDGLSTPIRSDGAKRIPSPQKVETSPRKFRLQSPTPNGAASTPARRIPIEQAIAEGQLSPEKAAKIGFKANHGNSATSVVSTPARRILISEKPTIPDPKFAVPMLESPAKQLANKELLAVPRPTILSLKGKERAVSPASQGASSSVIKPLPFPLVATASSTIESQAPVVQNLPKSGSSPAKSTLKVTSKIPRINKKPYARKVTEKSTNATTRKPTDLTKSTSVPSVNASTTKRPIRLVETAKKPVNPLSRPKPTISTSSTVLLKRKRDENPSPSKSRPTVLRQVPSSTSRQIPAGSKFQTDNESALPPDQIIHDTIWVRRMVTPPPEHPVPLTDPNDLRLQSNAVEPSSSLERNDLPPASPMKQDPLDVEQPEPPDSSSVSTMVAEVSPPVSDSGTSGLRRTTRARRSINSSNLNNGTVLRKPARRKAVTHQFDDVFSGMSITALKELTMTNTEKNQHYAAAKLETKVVRKEGLRPESPAVKIRTIVQRQQEDKERQRAERAKRRARRLGNDDGSASDIEASSDVGYSSPTDHIEDTEMDTKFDVSGPKHRRGAGDDEDYETPDRPLRDVRVRLFEDGSGDRQPDRRVKWDRGLFSLAYLDEVELGSRQNLKENRTLKSILAPAAKAVRLDTLGNLLQAETPLTDLVPENVTVKKFVYDNDVTPVAEPPPPKTTRSKSKRK